MRNIALALAGAMLVASAPAGARIDRFAAGEAKLQRVLEGRVAGEPVDCLNLRNIRSSQIIDRTAIVYRTGNGTLYVNRPKAGRESLSSWDVQSTKHVTSQLCSIDTVRLFDSASWALTGIVFLGDFVPYRRVESSRR